MRHAHGKWSSSGIVEAPVGAVWAIFVNEIPELSTSEKVAYRDRAAGPLERRPTAAGGFVTIDPNRRCVVHEGGWWYRGATCATEHPRGTLIRYEITNIARPPTRWLAEMFHARPAARRMDAEFRSRLETLARSLGCDAHVEG
jgi:hypothetical protein